MYKVGISGLGRGLGPGRVFNLMPDCKVVAGCDPNAAKREQVERDFPGIRTFADYQDMLDWGLDIVVVATPMPLHALQTVQALEAGCHVLQEVTLANSIQECTDIVRAVQAHPKQKFMLGENDCYLAHIMAWQKMWQDGLLGDFMYAEAEYVHDIRYLLRNPDGTPTWRASRPPIVYCTHSLGPLMKVTGERCTLACGLNTGSKLEPDLGHIDFGIGIFQTNSGGVIKVLRAQAVAREPMMHYYSIYGTRGCLETERPPHPMQTNAWLESVPYINSMIRIPVDANVPHAPAEAYAGGHGTVEYFMIQDFMGSIRTDTRSPIDVELAWNMTVPGLCAHQSALKGGMPVPVPACPL
ncbi:MAG: Gfo/Idh/MocA family protein [Anaerolineae bacterium]